MYDMRLACDNDPDCSHKICHNCSRALRSDQQKKDDHPGTRPGHIRNRLCHRCMIEGHASIHDTPQPQPEPMPDVQVGACGKSPDCHHKLCKDCQVPMRPNSTREVHHPGTVRHIRGGTCSKCAWDEINLLPQDFQDQRHILLSDKEMEHIMHNHPTAFTWHAERRKRLRLGEYS